MKPAEAAAIKSKAPLPLDNKVLGLQFNDVRVGYLNLVCVAYRLVHAVGPDHMPSAPYDHMAHGIAMENWNRALQYLRSFQRGLTKGRAGNSGRATAAKSETAVRPRFLRDDDLGAMLITRRKTGNVADSLDDALIGQLQADEEAFAADVGDDWYVDTPGTLEDVLAVTPADLELEDTVQRLPALTNSSISTADRSKRLKMTVNEAYKFTKSLGTKVTVNWGKEKIDEMRKREAEVTPTQLVDLMTSARLGKDQHPIDGPEPDDNDGAAVTVDGPGGVAGPPGSEDAVAASLLAIKAAMSHGGADLPPFEESCAWAGIDPGTLILKGAAGTPGDTKLKFWQVQSESNPSLGVSIHQPQC